MGRPIKESIIQLVYIRPETGGTRLIRKQKGSRRYTCASNGNTVFKLVADATPAVGEAVMKATDSDGNTYFVTKLTRNLATLTQWEEAEGMTFQFVTGDAVKWEFGSPNANETVRVENDD